MKKTIIALAALMVTVATYGQGQVNFNNRVTGVVDARVTSYYGTDYGTGLGSGYTAQLFGGPVGTPVDQLAPLFPSTTFRTSSAAAQGYVNGVTVEVPGVPSGNNATLVMRVFATGSSVFVGESNPITIAVGGGTLPPSNLAGMNAFVVLPEPSTIALGALGFAALLLRRRK